MPRQTRPPQTATARIWASYVLKRKTLKTRTDIMPRPKRNDFTPKTIAKNTTEPMSIFLLTLGKRSLTVSLSIATPTSNAIIPTKQQSISGEATAPAFPTSELKKTMMIKTRVTKEPTHVSKKARRTRRFCQVFVFSASDILWSCR